MERTMIVDHRTYTIKPSGILGWLSLYYEKGWPLQQRYLGNCLGFYLVKEGRQDQVVHLWAYQSQADREARRDALYADPAWQDYLREILATDFLVSWENKLLTPTWFSPDLGATNQSSSEPGDD
jgi:hypothetical protein